MIYDYFLSLSPVSQALLAGLFTWGLTALGAAFVFFTKEVNKKALDVMLGFAAGVMIAASFWSLLAPAIEMSEGSCVPAAIGFMVGGLFLLVVDQLLPHLHSSTPNEPEGLQTSWNRSILLILAITLHNIPEGLAIGVAFGAVAHGLPEASLGAAMALAMGIGLQNFPEGMAVSMPLRREGLSRAKCFWYGQLSGIVEPMAAVVGAVAVILAKPILPYALAFAAGAMIYVVVEELVPESQREKHSDLATMGVMVGFTIMMVLDVSLG